MNNSFQISGLDRNYLTAKNNDKNSALLVNSHQVSLNQPCCCCDECQCEKHIGDDSFVCPCSTSEGGCCC